MTKKWDEHRATIISLYKEQHKPLHEVQRVMREQYGFIASVRAYRSRFDRWGVHKYNCRRRGSGSGSGSGSAPPGSPGSTSREASPSSHSHYTEAEESSHSQSQYSIKSEGHDRHLHSPVGIAVKPPSSPLEDDGSQTTPLAGEQHGRHGQQQYPLNVMSAHPHSHQHQHQHQRYFPEQHSTGGSYGGSAAAGLIPPSPGGTESISSGSTMSRTSSISQTYSGDPNNYPHHHRRQSRPGLAMVEYSTSPTEYGGFEVYQQHPGQQHQQRHSYAQHYQTQQHYHAQMGGGGLAPPAGLAQQHDQSGGEGYVWSASGLQPPYGSGGDVKAPRE